MDSLSFTSAQSVFPDPPKPTSKWPASTWKRGDVLAGRYEIAKRTEGGMGFIYFAFDRVEQIPLAIKTFKPYKMVATPTGSFAKQFLGEQQKISQLFESEALLWVRLGLHQNLVNAKYVLRLAGQPYVFLEFVGGPQGKELSLRGRLRQGPVELALALSWTLQLCAGMTYATKVFPGLVHRDIKPENLLVTADQQIKITDFGLTKVFAELFEAEGGIVGTPWYMAPEQCLGLGHLTTQADIYSLGLVLYELVTQHHPFREAKTRDDILQAQILREPRPPNQLIPFIPKMLNDLILQCLQKRTEYRPANFDEIAKVLTTSYEALMGCPPSIQAAPTTSQPRPSESARMALSKAASYASLGRHEEAMALVDLAVQEDPHYSNAWVYRATMLAGTGKFREALHSLDQAFVVGLQSVDLWLEKGQVLRAMGDCRGALNCFNQALTIHPWSLAVLHEKTSVLILLERYEEAAESLAAIASLSSAHNITLLRQICEAKGVSIPIKNVQESGDDYPTLPQFLFDTEQSS